MISVLQLFLTHLHLLGSLLLLLQLPNVVHRGLEDGALVPTHLPVAGGTLHKGMQVHINAVCITLQNRFFFA